MVEADMLLPMDQSLSSGSASYFSKVDNSSTGVVIIPDILGLRPLFTAMCDHLSATQGWSVAAFEPWPGNEHLSIDERLVQVGSLSDDRILRDVSDAAAQLETERLAVIGFCMGGMFALKAAALDAIDRAVSFYGMIRLPEPWRSDTIGEPLAALDSDHAPVLSIVGSEDIWITTLDAQALAATGAEVVSYEGAAHGFVHDATRPDHNALHAADAWQRVASFIDSD